MNRLYLEMYIVHNQTTINHGRSIIIITILWWLHAEQSADCLCDIMYFSTPLLAVHHGSATCKVHSAAASDSTTTQLTIAHLTAGTIWQAGGL